MVVVKNIWNDASNYKTSAGLHEIWFYAGIYLGICYFFSVSILLSPKAKNLSVKYAETRSQLIGHIVDFLTNMLAVRLFNSTSIF